MRGVVLPPYWGGAALKLPPGCVTGEERSSRGARQSRAALPRPFKYSGAAADVFVKRYPGPAAPRCGWRQRPRRRTESREAELEEMRTQAIAFLLAPLLAQALAFSRAPLSMKEPGVGRRGALKIASLKIASLGAAGAMASSVRPPAALADDAVDYKAVASDIASLIESDKDKGPTLLRLAWHCSGTYDKKSGTGGSSGGTIRFQSELAHGGNAGLTNAVKWLEPLKSKYPSVSYGDLYTLAGVVAIKEAKGPTIPWSSGRVDTSEDTVTPDGRLPAADKGSPEKTASHLRKDVFGRMGFNDEAIVALSGAHALGRCHPDYSGYTGPWSFNPYVLSNAYYSLVLYGKWTPKSWDGPFQYEDATGKLMMLVSDLVLRDDPKFAKYAKIYAADNQRFFADFSKYFQQLEELGCKNLTPQNWA